eukprot:CAMPEP_0194535068 /NCGR_PEP_ID=MMETSP0253-20130528/73482_1 /TAXON_ID=2966 /ORGANISM="Noctiluca scintillans" /LENGTH=671 /DNA_ID=CAMNT_0039380795 /DNA_START=45 /DNA_END=2060 /DNA_ORIENTATION=-
MAIRSVSGTELVEAPEHEVDPVDAYLARRAKRKKILFAVGVCVVFIFVIIAVSVSVILRPVEYDVQGVVCSSNPGSFQKKNEPNHTFAVWAPHATSVKVRPTNATALWKSTPLSKLKGGFWEINVTNVSFGDEYQFEMETESAHEVVQRIDPCAADINDDGTASMVPSEFAWMHPRVHVPRNKMVIYELHVGSFTPQGTFWTAAGKLSYLHELGVNVIELMPVMYFCGSTSPVAHWGYRTCAPYAVSTAYGGATALHYFVDQAAYYNMSVSLTVDFGVADADTKLKDYDGWFEANGIYFYTDEHAYAFDGFRPNFGSSAVSDYLVANIDMWINKFHIGGFRWHKTVCIRCGDQSCYPDQNNPLDLPAGWKMMQSANELARKNGAFSIAEDGQGFFDMTRDPSTGGAGFDAQWDYSWFIKADESYLGEVVNVSGLADACLGESVELRIDGNGVIFSESDGTAKHQRIPEKVDPARTQPTMAQKKSMLFLGLVTTCNFIPMILQGQEVLTYDTFTNPPPPLDWSLMDAELGSGVLRQTTAMLNMRTNRDGTTEGLVTNTSKLLSVSQESDVFVIQRGTEDDRPGGSHCVIVMYNFSPVPQETLQLDDMPANGTWYVIFDGGSKQYNANYTDSCAGQTNLTVANGRGQVCVAAWSHIVLSKVSPHDAPTYVAVS